MNAWVLYFLIFVIKVFEVSLQTLRIVLITKEQRLMGALIGFVEVIIWVIVVSAVLQDITKDPFKIVVYALGFAVGNYVGSVVESIFAIGDVSVEVIAHKRDGLRLANQLRQSGLAVTSVNAHGMSDDREILFMHVPRKRINQTVQMVRSLERDVVITVHDIKPIYGGYKMLRK
jgi:uncharacterized protein YebE (UPF0316 family)